MKASSGVVALSNSGPLVRCPPVLQLVIFSVFLSFCCGAAYNATPFRMFVAKLYGWNDAELEIEDAALVAQSLKVFQTTDTIAGGCAGFVLGVLGPRFTHLTGYLYYTYGLYRMMRRETLWSGLLFQGISVQVLLNSVLSLANLFDASSGVAISILSGATDLSTMVFPLGLFLLNMGIISSPTVWVAILMGIGAAGCCLSFLLLPDSPYFPRNQTAQKLIVAELAPRSRDAPGGGDQDDDADARDTWDAESNMDFEVGALDNGVNAQNRLSSPASRDSMPSEARRLSSSHGLTKEVAPLLENPESYHAHYTTLFEHLSGDRRRDSALSVSMIAAVAQSHQNSPTGPLSCANGYSEASDTPPGLFNRLKGQGLFAQLWSVECFLITIVFTFSFVRTNLYLDGNQQILQDMQDDGAMANLFALYLPLSFFACILNGMLMQRIGVESTALYLNMMGTLVNGLSMINCLKLQYITFVAFLISKASVFSTMFGFLLETVRFQHFSIIAGLISIVGGVANELVGTWLIKQFLCTGRLQWYWVNAALLAGGHICFVPLGILWYRSYRHKRLARP